MEPKDCHDSHAVCVAALEALDGNSTDRLVAIAEKFAKIPTEELQRLSEPLDLLYNTLSRKLALDHEDGKSACDLTFPQYGWNNPDGRDLGAWAYDIPDAQGEAILNGSEAPSDAENNDADAGAVSCDSDAEDGGPGMLEESSMGGSESGDGGEDGDSRPADYYEWNNYDLEGLKIHLCGKVVIPTLARGDQSTDGASHSHTHTPGKTDVVKDWLVVYAAWRLMARHNATRFKSEGGNPFFPVVMEAAAGLSGGDWQAGDVSAAACLHPKSHVEEFAWTPDPNDEDMEGEEEWQNDKARMLTLLGCRAGAAPGRTMAVLVSEDGQGYGNLPLFFVTLSPTGHFVGLATGLVWT